MNAPIKDFVDADTRQNMLTTLQAQRDSYIAEGYVSAETRIDRIDRAIDILVTHAEAISAAMNDDFSCRPRQTNLMTDVTGSIECLKHSKKHLKNWMKSEKRPTMFPLNLLGARSQISYQPKGVVGVIAPWNFPFGMVFEPLAGVLAAGNRAMIKPSEFTPATSSIMAEIIGSAFDPSELAVFTGGPEVGQAFSTLPFDHLIFTGATSVARHIMSAAADNLVPVTLELGGKSPVIITRSADIGEAVQRIMVGKMLNAGQVCIAPDYLMVPEEALEQVIEKATKIVGDMYPKILDNKDYTAMVNDRHYQRISANLADAEKRAIRTVTINPADEDFTKNPSQKIAPTLIINPDDEAMCMQDEIFGPILPIKTYKNFEETISYINNRPRPLAAYFFGKDKAEEERFLTGTTSGGVSINDVMFHMLQKDLPFGGIGPSGMGAYHGIEGFKTFSHAKGIYRQPNRIPFAKLAGFMPPYGDASEKTIRQKVKK
ncbi:MAG: coniferyl aldehyde dehydrogenase [Rhizobiales bacterium TMED143]|nr:coniferyl aldehyde dehydrogenase [Rhodobiaceae bacterium]MBL6786516.1 coniferyl aldehyde dehydrogenase [PS1 clade bacterium]OUV92976.1 MAG: coniferyl aldehyde dehydrogenase [Rhizobiales bacterium TMED143]